MDQFSALTALRWITSARARERDFWLQSAQHCSTELITQPSRASEEHLSGSQQNLCFPDHPSFLHQADGLFSVPAWRHHAHFYFTWAPALLHGHRDCRRWITKRFWQTLRSHTQGVVPSHREVTTFAMRDLSLSFTKASCHFTELTLEPHSWQIHLLTEKPTIWKWLRLFKPVL